MAWRQVSIARLFGDAVAQVAHAVLEGDLAIEAVAHASFVRGRLLSERLFHFLRCLFHQQKKILFYLFKLNLNF